MPRYVDYWTARTEDAEEDVVIELTDRLTKLQGWEPRGLSPQQRNLMSLAAGEVGFVPIQARSGGTRGFSYGSESEDDS